LYYEAYIICLLVYLYVSILLCLPINHSTNHYFPNACILVPNIFTAIASNITPKNFLITTIPFGPSIFSIHFSDFNTKKITMQLMSMPIRILAS